MLSFKTGTYYRTKFRHIYSRDYPHNRYNPYVICNSLRCRALRCAVAPAEQVGKPDAAKTSGAFSVDQMICDREEEEKEAMSVSGPQPVGSGYGGNINPARTQQVAGGEAGAAPAQQAKLTQSATTTTTVRMSESVSTFLARLPNDSPLRTLMSQVPELNAKALQAWILSQLLEQLSEEKENKNESSDHKLLAMSLLGLAESRGSGSALFLNSSRSETTKLTIDQTKEVVAAYSANQQMATEAADPAGATQATQVNKIDTHG